MLDLISAIESKQPNEHLFQEASEIIEDGGKNPLTIYWAAKYIHVFNNEDSRFDKKILEVLDRLIEAGLSYSKYPEIFIDISKILAQLCFKYSNLKKANNYLLYFKDLSTDWPNWVYNYSAKLLYKLDLEILIFNPEPFFKLIEKSLSDNTTHNSQSTAILKEFLIDLYDYFINHENFKHKYFSLLAKLKDLIKPYLISVETDWNRFVSLSSDFRVIPDLTHEITDLDTALLHIDILKYLLDSSECEVSKLKARTEELFEETTNLQRLLKERDIQYSEQIKQIAAIQQSTPIGADRSNTRILVLGANAIDINVIYGIAKDNAIPKHHLEVHNDYDENKRYNIEKIRYNSPYAGILIGPIAHKIIGLGDNSSLISKLSSEDGYPPFVEVRNKSGSLKITKSSFTEALEKLLTIIKANTPD